MSISSPGPDQIRGLLEDLRDSVARLEASGLRFASMETINEALRERRPPEKIPPELTLEFHLRAIGCERAMCEGGQVWRLSSLDQNRSKK
jgi:hypothetical protein